MNSAEYSVAVESMVPYGEAERAVVSASVVRMMIGFPKRSDDYVGPPPGSSVVGYPSVYSTY